MADNEEQKNISAGQIVLYIFVTIIAAVVTVVCGYLLARGVYWSYNRFYINNTDESEFPYSNQTDGRNLYFITSLTKDFLTKYLAYLNSVDTIEKNDYFTQAQDAHEATRVYEENIHDGTNEKAIANSLLPTLMTILTQTERLEQFRVENLPILETALSWLNETNGYRNIQFVSEALKRIRYQ